MIKRLFVICLLLASPVYAGGWLKQGTATTIRIGPFIKLSDNTLDSSQTVTNFTVKLIPHSDATGVTVTSFSPTASGGSNDSVFAASGMYELELTATNTATAGRFDVVVTTSGTACYPVFDSFMVVAADQWNHDVDGDIATIDDIYAEPTTNLTSAGSIGKLFVDDLNIPVGNVSGLVWDELQASHVALNTFGNNFLAPTVPGRTLDVSSTGEAGIDWANVGNATSAVSLTNTAVGSVSGSVGSVVGAVGSITAPVVVGSISNGAITANALGSDALTAAKVAADVGSEIRTGLLTVPKNVVYSNFVIEMVDSADGITLKTGLAITCQVSKDGSALATCANPVTEIGNGLYVTNVSSGDLNADEVWLRFTAATARRLSFKIRTQR